MIDQHVELYREIQEKLKEPFDIRLLEFRPGQFGTALAYVDVSEYEKRLQEVASGLFSITDLQIIGTGEQTVIGITVTVAGIPMAGVSDPGKPTRAYAQALKRACVGHGLGAYLYDMPKLPNVPLDDKKQVACSHLSIAAYCYEYLGLEIPEDVHDELNRTPANLLYDPNKRVYQQQPAAPARQAPTANRPAPQRPQGSSKLYSEAENPHSGKLTFKQVNALYSAGLSDDEISQMDKATAKQAVDAKFNGADGDEIRAQFLSAVPVAAGGRRAW